MKIAIQMDPIAGITPTTDTTFVLALEAQRRGWEVFYYTPNQLVQKHQLLHVNAQPLTCLPDSVPFYDLGEMDNYPITFFDVLLIRQDPPFNMDYLSYTYLLEPYHPDVFMVNPPAEIRHCPEKLFPLQFHTYMPPTLITKNVEDILAFKKEQHNIVLKPLYGFGGKDIYLSKDDDSNLETVIDMLITHYNEPIMAQAFLSNVSKGDKRVIMIDGEVAGAINRVPKDHSIRSNLVRGGTAEKTTLTPHEHTLCEEVGKELKHRGFMLVGLDLIDGYLTEINVTSPTGIQAIDGLFDTNLPKLFWDKVVSKI